MLRQTVATPTLGTVTQDFTYTDGFGRLNTAQETNSSNQINWSQNYGYDNYGNRAVTSGNIPYPGQTPTAVSQFVETLNGVSVNRNHWATGSVYDSGGNMQSAPNQQGFTYDAENRLVSSTQPGTPSISYVYDGDGQRVQKTVGTAVTTYVYDANRELASEYGTPTDGAGTSYVSVDQLWSTRLLQQSAGTVRYYDYFPFGEDIASSQYGRGTGYASGTYPANGPDFLSLKFTGKERDWETGLDFFQARYYSAWEGRFGQTDPANAGSDSSSPQSFHGYAYVSNSPLVNTDPDGLEQMAIYTPRPAAPQLDISLILWLLQGGGPISRETGTAPRKMAAAAPAPKKTGRLMRACTEKRIASGLTGVMNLAMATYKAPELLGSVAGLAATGVGAPAGALLGVYGTTSIFGQGLAGTAQLYSAFTGQYGTSARAEQVGNILSGPATGLGTLIMGGNMESAEKNAAVESMFTGGTAFVDGMAKEGASWVIGLADWSFGYLGTQDSGPNQCGKVP